MRTTTRILLGLTLIGTSAACSTFFGAPPEAPDDYRGHPRAAILLERLREDHGFTKEDLESVTAALREAVKNPKLIEAEQQAKEKTLNWSAYRPIHLHDRNRENGARFLAENAAWLARAETEYGVPGPVIAAILGVETKYGRFTGGVRVLDSLTTQGFDHPTRADFFLNELVEFFVLCRDAGFNAREIKGSYAGAMGAAQFMPSNYRRLAVDFDGDGRKDLWQLPDAIGSIANYLVNYTDKVRWRRGEPLAVPAGEGEAPDASLPRNGKLPTHALKDLSGVSPSVTLPADTPVGLIELPLDQGQQYWLGLSNFYGVMTYNPRIFYAMSVTQLAQELAQAAQP